MSKTNPVDAVLLYVKTHGAITNRECRELLPISYDHAILLLGELARLGALSREGKASGTHYKLGKRLKSDEPIAEFAEKFAKRISVSGA
jgi:predicted HTH transcriptional regulator